jgi:hypothetical protein
MSAAPTSKNLRIGQRVRHSIMGLGQIVSVNQSEIGLLNAPPITYAIRWDDWPRLLPDPGHDGNVLEPVS